jgi:hypothetical protein
MQEEDPPVAGYQSGPGKSEGQIPYLKKGKWKAFSPEKSMPQERQDQINADHLIALELEREEARRANLEISRLRAQLEKAKRGADLKDAARISVHECVNSVKKATRSADVAHKVNAHLGIALGTDRASSKLPEHSGLRRAMHGDRGSSDPSDSSSNSSDRNDQRGSESKRAPRSVSDDSIDYHGRDLFCKGPESDHSSDSKDTKRRKSEKRKWYRAKLQEIKFQQSFLKQDPPFKYGGEVQASLFKKWVREVRNWIKRGRLSTKQGIITSGQYCTGRAYKFFKRDILSS